MNAIANFAFNDHLVRAIQLESQPWFVGKDVCAALDIKDHHQALEKLDADERGGYTIPTPLGDQSMIIVSLPGVFRLIFRSRKEEAEQFRRWLAHDVLPEIMRTGSYKGEAATPQPVAMDADAIGLWRMKLDMQKEARLLFGARPARALWHLLGFPAIETLPGTAEAKQGTGGECLRHLLAYTGADGISVLDMIGIAFDAADNRYGPLRELGVRLMLNEEDPGILVATSALAVRIVYANTPWAKGLHSPALRSLQGVRNSQNQKFAGGVQSHTLFIPLELLTL